MSHVITIALVDVEDDGRGGLLLKNHGGFDVRIEAADVELLRRKLNAQPELRRHRGRSGTW